MDPRLGTALAVVIGVPLVLVGYIYATELVLRFIPERRQGRIRPWLWLLPALAFLVFFLVWPTLLTIARSFQGKAAGNWNGVDNYVWFFTNGDALIALRNNVLWVVLLTLFTVGVGLLVAVLVDRVRYESIAKSVIFVPLAISGTAVAVIWRFMVDFNPQVGTLNAIAGVFGAGPFAWLQTDTLAFNTILLIVVMAWMWTGFAMVILSAALKGISVELLEAARVDGATEWQVFRRIVFPLLTPTIAVVSTTIIITALKAFDIVVRHDRRAIRHERGRAPDVPGDVPVRRLRTRERARRDPAPCDHSGHGPQHQPVPRAGGDPMTATSDARRATATGEATGILGRRLRRVLLHAVVIILMAIWLLPTIGLFVNSIREPGVITNSGWWTALFPPSALTVSNYADVLAQPGIVDAFINSLFITIPATIIPIFVAAFAAYAFAWMNFPGRNVLFVVVVGLLVIPLQTTFIPILQAFNSLGFAGQFLTVWLAHTGYGLPFAIYLLRNYMGGLPREVFESAYIDGASPVTAFFRLAIPMSVPVLASLAIFQFLFIWNDLLVAYVYLGLADPTNLPLTNILANLVGSTGAGWELLAPAAFISMALPLIVFLSLQRYFVRGITGGAVKG